MKKIINGKKYDTDTAEEVGCWSNHQYGSFDFCEETLYRKKNGEFFLEGYGGPLTCYREACGSNEWRSGTQIIPMTESEAREWAMEYLDGDEFEEIFGIVEE